MLDPLQDRSVEPGSCGNQAATAQPVLAAVRIGDKATRLPDDQPTGRDVVG